MNKLLDQSAFILLLIYCFFNVFNFMWLQLDLPQLFYWISLCALFFVLRRLHTFSSEGFNLSQPEVLAFCLIVVTFLAVFAQHIFLTDYTGEAGVSVLTNTMNAWGVSMIWMIVGGACASFTLKESPITAVVILGVMLLGFSNGLNDQLMIDWWSVNQALGRNDMTHLSIEVIIIIPLALAYAVSPKTRPFVILAGIAFLFSAGGRTSILMFVATFVFLSLKKNPVRNILMLSVAALIGWVGLTYIVSSSNIDIENPLVRRVLLMGGVEEDGSYQARLSLLVGNLNNFTEQFLFGNPILFVKQHGTVGGYIHNILSAWEFYGFFGFFGIVLLLIYSYRRMAVSLKHSESPNHVFGAFILMYTIGSVIVGKSVLFPLLWFSLGFWLLKPVLKHGKRRRSLRRRRKVSMEMSKA